MVAGPIAVSPRPVDDLLDGVLSVSVGAPWRRSFRNRLRILGSRFTLKSVSRRFDSVPVLEWIVITGSLLGLALALELWEPQ